MALTVYGSSLYVEANKIRGRQWGAGGYLPSLNMVVGERIPKARSISKDKMKEILREIEMNELKDFDSKGWEKSLDDEAEKILVSAIKPVIAENVCEEAAWDKSMDELLDDMIIDCYASKVELEMSVSDSVTDPTVKQLADEVADQVIQLNKAGEAWQKNFANEVVKECCKEIADEFKNIKQVEKVDNSVTKTMTKVSDGLINDTTETVEKERQQTVYLSGALLNDVLLELTSELLDEIAGNIFAKATADEHKEVKEVEVKTPSVRVKIIEIIEPEEPEHDVSDEANISVAGEEELPTGFMFFKDTPHKGEARVAPGRSRADFTERMELIKTPIKTPEETFVSFEPEEPAAVFMEKKEISVLKPRETFVAFEPTIKEADEDLEFNPREASSPQFRARYMSLPTESLGISDYTPVDIVSPFDKSNHADTDLVDSHRKYLKSLHKVQDDLKDVEKEVETLRTNVSLGAYSSGKKKPRSRFLSSSKKLPKRPDSFSSTPRSGGSRRMSML